MKKLFLIALIILSSCSDDSDRFVCSETCGKITSVEYISGNPVVTFKNTCGDYIIDDTANPNFTLAIGDSYCSQ